MNTCDTCRHWGTYKRGERFFRYRECGKAVSAPFWSTGITYANFGCTLWAEQKTPRYFLNGKAWDHKWNTWYWPVYDRTKQYTPIGRSYDESNAQRIADALNSEESNRAK